MYLKSIRLEGFKSFADKTIFELKEGITAIVGPNGSGKSNIVDAIRWVLGEQSVKSLRGSNTMTDVIFSGTERRDGMKKASVTLVFDNSEHQLNSEFSEIEVKRVVYKTGENEYYLNNTQVRLKDITELFIDTGGGLDSYNIISQGSVTDIINSKPHERRQIFESAAGVLKYKKRKDESLRKLERTKENLVRVKLIIEELETTVGPLKEQSEQAKKFVSLKEELKSLEIALSAKDINDINNERNTISNKINNLKEKLESFNNSLLNSNIESLKLEITKSDEKINELNKEILKLTEELSHLSSEKNITMERTKFEYSEQTLETNLIGLKEEELNLKKEIELRVSESKTLNDSVLDLKEKYSNKNKELQSLNIKKSELETKINTLNKELMTLENRSEILENNISNNERVPYSVKNILNNPRLKGIHNTIGNLISVPDDYLVALDVALGSSLNFLVVDNEKETKNAINYLKDNKLGRATFLPLNIIKPRFIDTSLINRLKEVNGYVGIFADLVSYEDTYKNIILNQMGNIIVTKDIDSMNLIGKITEYKYRVVSLDGSIIHAGGSISGGSSKNNNLVNLKLEQEKLKNNIASIKETISLNSNELKSLDKDMDLLTNQITELFKNLSAKNNDVEISIRMLDDLKEKLNRVTSEIKGINDINNNSLDDTLVKIMEEYNKVSTKKEILEAELKEVKNKKADLNNELNSLEKEMNTTNNEYRSTQNELTKMEVLLSKLEMRLDSLLLLLNEEYNLTFEYAHSNYTLDIEESLAREKVSDLKRHIRSLGEVNIGSIKEYERLNTRYEFLKNQQNDLELSMENLLAIISEMDEIMVSKFKDSFERISKEFTSVFKTIFKGGEGSLRLTDPDDYLNTGIELVAVPPGKKLNSTQALSGGEKSLTAICLLFAILNVSKVPFIILDEVEAALDEANVDMFGEYLSHKKNDSQFILITHKKRMMEYADILYGITMQELGVSKVVGVKLENM